MIRFFGCSHIKFSSHVCISHVWSAGSGFDWGRERGGPAVPVYFPADRGGREYWGATERWGESEYGGGVGPVIGHASGNSHIPSGLCWRNKHHTWLSVYSCVLQQMEISANELKDVLNKVVSKCTYFWIIITLNFCVFFYIMPSRNNLLFTDKDIYIEGFSRESCRSMIALMDVSFVSRLHHLCKAPSKVLSKTFGLFSGKGIICGFIVYISQCGYNFATFQ